jgi:hypothetical protein
VAGLGSSLFLPEVTSAMRHRMRFKRALLIDRCTKKEETFPDFVHSVARHYSGFISTQKEERQEIIHRERSRQSIFDLSPLHPGEAGTDHLKLSTV